MKKLLFALLLICGAAVSPLLAQTNIMQTEKVKIDPRLYEVFEKKDLDRWQVETPHLLQRWNFYLDNAFYIVDEALSDEKELSTYQSLTQKNYPYVEITNVKDFNILKIEQEQKLIHHWDRQAYYRIKGTKMLLVFYPEQYFAEQLNIHLKKNY